MTGTFPPETEQTPAPEQQETTPPAPEAPAPTGGPWANDLNTTFEDPTVRASVDGFLREHVQPYVTKLEKERGSGNEHAEQLYQDLQESPVETYLAITAELYGDETADAVARQLHEQLSTSEQPAPEQAQSSKDEALDPRVEELLKEREEAKAEQQYQAELDRIKAAHEDLDEDMFHPFVVSAEGDFDLAYDAYAKYMGRLQERFGPTPPEAPTPPPAIGSDAQAPPAPPTEKKHASLDAALDDFFVENRTQAPPTVGSV